MADDTDTAFGIILFLLFLALIGYAVGGGSWTSSTAGTTTPNPTPIYTTTPGSTTATSKSGTNIPGGTLQSCPGKVIANKTATSSNGSVNLKIYFSPHHGDRNCAVATAFGWPNKTQGRLTVRLRFADYSRQPVAGICGSYQPAAHDSTDRRVHRRHLQPMHHILGHIHAFHRHEPSNSAHRICRL
jgi:hypothetical protein